MQTVGVGIDLVEVARVELMLARKGDHVYRRLLTEAEARYCVSQPNPAQHLAARLAAKEAAFKSLQSGPDARRIAWRELEIVRDGGGSPSVVYHGVAASVVSDLRIVRTLVSLSHTPSQATAIVIQLAPLRS